MRMYDLIYKKREGEKLEQSEIDYIIAGYTRDEIPDYQMSAWAMAVYFQGMDAEETAHPQALHQKTQHRLGLMVSSR